MRHVNGKQAAASTRQHVFLQLTTLKHFDSDVFIVCIWICDLICVDLHVERYDWTLYFVFVLIGGWKFRVSGVEKIQLANVLVAVVRLCNCLILLGSIWLSDHASTRCGDGSVEMNGWSGCSWTDWCDLCLIYVWFIGFGVQLMQTTCNANFLWLDRQMLDLDIILVGWR